jgi:succinoglycan biosynthesis protein ExoA
MSESLQAEPLVSVIVPVRNEAGPIAAVLRSILSQEAPEGGFEVIVADGLSDDGTREILRKIADETPLLRLVDNPGQIVSTGLNQALAVARGQIIVRMDAHTEYASDYVRQCVAVLKETGADNVGGAARTRAHTYLQTAIAAAYHSPFSVGGARFHNVRFEGSLDTVPYGCWRREIFTRLGRFDEGLARNQDDEFNLRIILNGGRIWQSPRIKSWYTPRSSLSALFRQYYRYGYWKVRVIQKHRQPASIRHLVPGIFLASLSVCLVGGLYSTLLSLLGAAIVVLYAACLVAASLHTASKSEWRLFFVLPVTFAVYHFGYGIGFLRGLLDFVALKRSPGRIAAALARAPDCVSGKPAVVESDSAKRTKCP